ncbi:MAG: tRNA 2-thiouridine(34) synthase MnmA [Alphaproteobacteria bacterium]
MENAAELLEITGEPARTRVAVAMSGGVDSSVAAGIAAAAGYDVIGLTLQLYDQGSGPVSARSCCAGRDIHDARRVADTLGIAHYVLDYQSRFSDAVIEDFADSYLAGETPLPCVRCNQRVKFTGLLDMARELGAKALVTGHYVAARPGQKHRTLHSAVDLSRDQSYFLFATTQSQLDYLRFPLGNMTKDQTRALARQFGLDIADKPDSQDICFVPTGHYSALVEKLRPQAADPGEIVHIDGRVLGRHQGIIRFTVGQRRGLGVASGEPLFVIKIDAERRQVVVGPRAALAVDKVTLKDINWLGDTAPETLVGQGRRVWVKLRSTQPSAPARLVADRVGFAVVLEGAEEGIAPGQACVIYDGQGAQAQVLGGGWITGAVAQPGELLAAGE